jgi:hypothetical protein
VTPNTPKEFTEWVTVFGAAIAAITGSWNLLLQFRGKRDHFVVRLGSVSPTIEQETMLHVISHSDHPIALTDWGFVEANGRFTSLRMEWEVGTLQSEEVSSRGASELSGFGASFETGHVRSTIPLGAYAMSVTQKRPCVCFASGMPPWRRVWIRLRLRLQPHYLAW